MAYTKYPNKIDTNIELPIIVDLRTPVVASVINRHRDAILAIESELGISPSREYGTVRDRLDAIEAKTDSQFASGVKSNSIPAHANSLVRYDGASGSFIHDSSIYLDDNNNLTNVRSLTLHGAGANRIIIDAQQNQGFIGIGVLAPIGPEKIHVSGNTYLDGNCTITGQLLLAGTVDISGTSVTSSGNPTWNFGTNFAEFGGLVTALSGAQFGGNLTFRQDVLSPIITQIIENIDVLSSDLLVQAQSNSVLNGSAGDLNLYAGEKTGGGTGTDGSVNIRGAEINLTNIDGSITYAIFNSSGFQPIGDIIFPKDQVLPQIYQAVEDILVFSDTLTISAQDNSAFDGYAGDLALQPGAKLGGGVGTNGSLLLNDGYGVTQIAINDSAIDFSTTIITSSGNPTWNFGYGSSIFGGLVTFLNNITLGGNIAFAQTVISPSITQIIETIDLSSSDLLVQAQSNSTFNGSAGNLELSAGEKLGGGAGSDGYVYIRGADIILTNIDGSVVYATFNGSEFQPQGDLVFPENLNSPDIYQETQTSLITSFDLTIRAQGNSVFDGTAGDLILSGGIKSGAGTGTHGNIAFHYSPGTWAGGSEIIFIGNADVEPSSPAVGGAFLWAFNDILKLNSDLYIDGYVYADTFFGPVIPSGDIIFEENLDSPDIYQTTQTTLTTSYDLTIHAQNNSVLDGYAGDLILSAGDKLGGGSGTDGSVYIRGENVVLTNVDGTVTYATFNSSTFNPTGDLVFLEDHINPLIYQITEDDSVSSYDLTIHAQNNSVFDGTAGDLILSAGDKTGGGTGTDGSISIKGNTVSLTNVAGDVTYAIFGPNAGIQPQGDIIFPRTLSNPKIYQEIENIELTSEELLVHAQDNSVLNGSGGDLRIHPGIKTGGGSGSSGLLRTGAGSHWYAKMGDGTGSDLFDVYNGGMNMWVGLTAASGYGFNSSLQTIWWSKSVSTPILNQADDNTSGITGQTLTIQAQKATHASSGTGGDLQLLAGTGPTANGFIRIGSTAQKPGQIIFNTPYTYFQDGSTFIAIFQSTVVSFYPDLWRWQMASTPEISQQSNAADGATGKNFQIRAQVVSGLNSVGGNLILWAGDANNVGGSTGGDVVLKGGVGYTRHGSVSIGESSPASWQGGGRIVFVQDATSEPSAAASGGAFLWSYGGHLKLNSNLYVLGSTLYLGDGANNTTWHPTDYTTGGPWAQDALTIRGADLTSSGSYGNDLILRPGLGVDVAHDGDMFLQDARGNNLITIEGGIVNIYGAISPSGDIIFDDFDSPDIYQTATTGHAGYTLTVQAQNAVTTGGDLVLDSGTGGTDPGIVWLKAGGTDVLNIRNWAIVASKSFTWAGTVSSPTLNQQNGDLGHGVTGQSLYVTAQSNTHADAGTGGNLVLGAGNGFTAQGTVVLQCGGYTAMGVWNGGVDLYHSWLQFVTRDSAPLIVHTQDTTAGGSRPTFTIRGQDSTVAGSTGAALDLQAGDGVTYGGSVFIRSGDGATWDGAVYLYSGMSDQLAYFAAAGLYMNKNDIQFTTLATAPSIYHVSDTTVGGTRPTTTIQAQSSTVAGSTGGSISLNAGTGVSTGGNIAICSGGGTTKGDINFYRGSDRQAYFGASWLALASPNIIYENNLWGGYGPALYQNTRASGTGDTFIIHAQDVTVGTGGQLQLKSGAGSVAHGDVAFYRGSVLAATFGASSLYMAQATREINFSPDCVTPYIYQADEDVGNGEILTIRAQFATEAGSTGGNLHLQSGQGVAGPGWVNIYSGNTLGMGVSNTQVSMYLQYQTWNENTTAPTISQATIGSASGQTFTVRAQDAATNGGSLRLLGGNGASGGYGGYVVLQPGTGASEASTIIKSSDAVSRLEVFSWGTVHMNHIHWWNDFSNPSIYQLAATAGGVKGSSLSIMAQPVQSTGVAASTGGDLYLRGGAGWDSDDIGGDVYIVAGQGGASHGNIFMYSGDSDLKIRINDSGLFFPSSDSVTVTGMIYANGGITGVYTPSGDIVFPEDQVNPSIYQATEDDGTASDTLTLRAQNNTYAGSTGGVLSLKSGDGTVYSGEIFLQTGTGGTGPGWIYVYSGSTQVVYFNQSGMTNAQQYYSFKTDVASPTITQENTVSGSGRAMTIHAQGSTIAGTTGGLLNMYGGDVTSAGAASTAGSVVLRGGTGYGANDIGGWLYLQGGNGAGGQGSVVIREPAGVNWWTWWTSTDLTTVPKYITFHDATIGPTLRQSATSSASGQALTIQAQNAATTGGALYLTGGTGGTTQGDVRLYSGATLMQKSGAGYGLSLHHAQTFFDKDVTSPKVYHDTTTAATGQNLEIRAQNAATTGGALLLRSGTGGTSAGVVYVQPGGKNSVWVTGSSVCFYVSYATFHGTTSSPYLTQETDGTQDVVADDLQIRAQPVNCVTATTGAYGGDLGLLGGPATGHASNKHGNVWFHTAPGSANWQSMQKGIFIGNAVVEPSTVASGGAFLWAYGDDLKLNSDLYVGGTIYSSSGIMPTGDIVFPESLNSPDIYQADSTTHHGYTLAIRAQHANAGSYNGGNLTLTAGNGWGAGGSVILTPGDGSTPGDIYLADYNGDTALQANSNGVYVGKQYLVFLSHVTSPYLIQDATNSASGQTLAVQAQSSSFSGSTGGTLVLSAGTGISAGGGVYVRAQQASWIILENTSGVASAAVTPSGVGNYKQYYYFDSAVSSPALYQANVATAGATGQNLAIQAQNATGTGTCYGGSLYLKSGTGSSDANAGGVYIYCGSTFAATFSYTQNEILTNLKYITWQSSVSSPTIMQNGVSSGDGQTMTIQAQTTTEAAKIGGTLALRAGASGSGAVPGTINVGGSVDKVSLYCGAASYVTLGYSGGTFFECIAATPQIYFGTGNLLFDWETTVTMKHETRGSGDGVAFTIEAQTTSAVGGDGGHLYLKSGSPGSGGVPGDVVCLVPEGGTIRMEDSSLDVIATFMADTSDPGLHMNTRNIAFAAGLTTGFSIYQDEATGATGATATLKAQDTSSTTSTHNGGALYIKGGSATNASGGAGGGIYIDAGSAANTGKAGGSIFLRSGDGGTTDGYIYFYAGNGGSPDQIAYFNASGLYMQKATVEFGNTVNSPTIKQASTTAASGQTFTLHAQTSSFAGSTGGHLLLHAGDGVSYGGDVTINAGAGSSSGTVYIKRNNSTWWAFTTSSRTIIYQPYVLFEKSVATPVLYQEDDSTGSITGDEFTIHAQNATGATSTGGNLKLQSGTGTTSAGNLALYYGADKRMELNSWSNLLIYYYLGFSTSISTPLITQADVNAPGAAAQYMRIQAQSNVGGGGSTGGDLRLTTGTGDTAGAWYLQNGSSTAIAGTSVYIEMYRQYLQWYGGVSSPKLFQQASSAAKGQDLTIQAQESTYAVTGAGGDLLLKSGVGTGCPGEMRFFLGATEVMQFDNNTSLLILWRDTLRFASTCSSPTITHESIANAAGTDLTIQAQTCSSASYLAGDLLLKSGAGQTAAYNGDVIVFCGAGTHTSFENDGTAAGTRILTHQPLFEFKYSISSPIIRQEADSNNSVTGYRLTIRAQSATGTTSNGGMLALEGGAGTQYGGDVSIAPGGGTSDQSGAVLVGTNVVTRDYYKLYQTFMGKYGRLHAFGEHAYAQTKYSVDGDRQASDWQFGGSVTGTGDVYLGANGSDSELFPVPEGRVIGIWAMVAITEPSSSKKMGVCIVEAVVYRNGSGALTFLTGSPTYSWIGGSAPSTGNISLTLSSGNAIRFKGTGCTSSFDTRFSGIARMALVG